MSTPLPVTIIGGYLGSSKTTLVNPLLRNADGGKLAILVKEFGALPIDEDLIETQSDQMISIVGSCICSSFGSDLTAALMDLAALSPRPDHMLIEASGVAMPGTIAPSITIPEGFDFAGVVLFADSETIEAQAQDEYLGDTILRQLSAADLIMQTKTDLVCALRARSCFSWLQSVSPQARILTAQHGALSPDVILGLSGSNRSYQTTPHGDDHYHACAISKEGRFDIDTLLRSLTRQEFYVIRAKGFCQDISGAMQTLQIAGLRATVSASGIRSKSGHVVIGHRDLIDQDAIIAQIEASREHL